MTRKQLYANLDAEEFYEWLAYSEVFGIPDPIIAEAKLHTVIYRANGVDAKIEDMLPDYRKWMIRPKDGMARFYHMQNQVLLRNNGSS